MSVEMVVMRADDLVVGSLEPAGRRVGADEGEAQVSIRAFHQADDHAVGVWECTPGGWNIVDRPDTEAVVILSGRARLTTLGGEPVEVVAGDLVVLPQGWSGRWEILETCRKAYFVAG
jgi:uncharacterized cupin superfamily protein